MSWATHIILKLKEKEEVTFKPRGHSMTPIIKDGATVIASPEIENLKKGNIVLCRVRGKEYLHFITALSSDYRYQIGNAKGKTNGWISIHNIFGRVISINGKPFSS
jgi:hypothetical protein